MVGRGVGPGAFWDEGRSDLFEFGIVEDGKAAAFDVDGVAGVDEGFGCGRGEGGTMLERLGLEMLSISCSSSALGGSEEGV